MPRSRSACRKTKKPWRRSSACAPPRARAACSAWSACNRPRRSIARAWPACSCAWAQARCTRTSTVASCSRRARSRGRPFPLRRDRARSLRGRRSGPGEAGRKAQNLARLRRPRGCPCSTASSCSCPGTRRSKIELRAALHALGPRSLRRAFVEHARRSRGARSAAGLYATASRGSALRIGCSEAIAEVRAFSAGDR